MRVHNSNGLHVFIEYKFAIVNENKLSRASNEKSASEGETGLHVIEVL